MITSSHPLKLHQSVPIVSKTLWERSVQVLNPQALTNKQTISALVEVLEDAAAMGAECSELGEGVRRRLECARAWEDEAAQFFAKPGRAPLFALEVRSPSLSSPCAISWSQDPQQLQAFSLQNKGRRVLTVIGSFGKMAVSLSNCHVLGGHMFQMK